MILKDFSGGVYKLQGDDPLGPLGIMLREPSVHTNRGRMSATVTFSREAEDRSGDIVVLKGMRLDGHQKNPVVLLNHNKNHVVGYCQDALGNYTVKKSGDKLIGEVFFCKGSQLGIDTFRAVEAKILRGTSIGFLPMGKIEKRLTRGTIFHESNLIEGTITPIGDNEDAIIEAVHKTFGRQGISAELAAVLPTIPERPVVVTSGWDAIEKGGTFKTAEPKEIKALHRESTYYICPHCDKEITHEHMHKDDDGTVRHGECRGALVLAPPEQVTEAVNTPVGTIPNGPSIINVPKALTYVTRSRFLPGLRRKSMDASLLEDDTLNNGDDELLPQDDDLEGEAGSGMKGGAEAHHGVNDLLMQSLQFIEDSMGLVDNATAKKTLAKVSKWIGKALSALHAGHASYLEEEPDQAPLPGKPPGSDMDGDGIEDDEDPDADGDGELDNDEGGDGETDEWDEGESDESDTEEKPKKKKKPAFAEKSICEWRTKALNSYWEDFKRAEANLIEKSADEAKVKAVVDGLAKIVTNDQWPKAIRHAVNVQRKALVGSLVTKAAPVVNASASDEWAEWN